MATLWRVRDHATFAQFRHARRVRRGPVTVTFVPAPSGPARPPRVAFAVGKHAGNAVVRNRIRRRVRAVLTDLAPDLAPGAYLVGAGPTAATVPAADLRRCLAEATTKAATA